MGKQRPYKRWTNRDLGRLFASIGQGCIDTRQAYEKFIGQSNGSVERDRTYESFRARLRRYKAGQTESTWSRTSTARTKVKKGNAAAKQLKQRPVVRVEPDQASSPESSFSIRPPPVLQLQKLVFRGSSVESESSKEDSYAIDYVPWAPPQTSMQTSVSPISSVHDGSQLLISPLRFPPKGTNPLRRTYQLHVPTGFNAGHIAPAPQQDCARGKQRQSSFLGLDRILQFLNNIL